MLAQLKTRRISPRIAVFLAKEEQTALFFSAHRKITKADSHTYRNLPLGQRAGVEKLYTEVKKRHEAEQEQTATLSLGLSSPYIKRGRD